MLRDIEALLTAAHHFQLLRRELALFQQQIAGLLEAVESALMHGDLDLFLGVELESTVCAAPFFKVSACS